jgi:hypothetical protein
VLPTVAPSSAVPLTLIKLTVDADTGFGGPINAAKTVAAYERVGIAALHIEDQGIPASCTVVDVRFPETMWPSSWEESVFEGGV